MARRLTTKIRPFEDADLPDILRIYEETWGEPPTARMAERWDWLHTQNPAAALAPAKRFVGVQDGKVIAYTGSFPVRFKLGADEPVIYMEGDFIAEESARTSDPTMALRIQRAAVEVEGHLLANSMDYTEPQMRLRRRLDHKFINMRPSCFRIYRTASLLEGFVEGRKLPGFLGRGPLAALMSGTADLGLKLVNAWTAPKLDNRFKIERLEAADERLDRMWARLKDKFVIAPISDRAFVQWRYFEDPGFKDPVFAITTEDGEIAGYVVARTSVHDQLDITRGRIIDMFCDPTDPGAAASLTRAALDYFEQSNPHIVGCRGLNPKIRKTVKKSFYLNRGGKEEPALMLWRGAPEMAKTVYSPASWHMTLALTEPSFHP